MSTASKRLWREKNPDRYQAYERSYKQQRRDEGRCVDCGWDGTVAMPDGSVLTFEEYRPEDGPAIIGATCRFCKSQKAFRDMFRIRIRW